MNKAFAAYLVIFNYIKFVLQREAILVVRYQSDIELADGFKDGDQKAFKEVFERFNRPLLYFAVQLIQDKAEAEDIIIQTMTKLWNRHKNFESLVNIRAFLYITARNSCLDYLKFNRRRERAKEDLLRLMGEDEDTILSRLVKAELFESIREEIENLPPQRKAVFKMFYIEDLSMEEIANMLNTTQSTVRGNKFQAIEQLKNSLSRKKILSFLGSVF